MKDSGLRKRQSSGTRPSGYVVPETVGSGAEQPCRRAGRVFGGCSFRPRYDVGPPTQVITKANDAHAAAAFIEATKPRTYVRDVCERCGRTVERQPATPAEGAEA